MDLTKNKAVAFFLSYVILKKLDEVNLQLFRKIEKQAKQGIKIDADISFLINEFMNLSLHMQIRTIF